MDDPTLKIQTFYPTWEEFKDFKKYINYIESQGAHRAGLARIVPPKEYVPRRSGYNDVTKFRVTIKKPICQVVATVDSQKPGVYQQVNVPQRTMTVSDFRDLANSPKYAPPPHRSYSELEQIYWNRITSHCGIYGADVCGSISDPSLEHWNINKLNTILDYVGKDYDVSIDGVNTAYLYFGMWKTTFGWHTEDMDLYSINYLHFGAPKSWFTIPPSYGRKFEKLCAALLPKSYAVCNAFLRHKMTMIHPKWLDDYDIPYDRVTQEPGHIMITFPYGYHAGFNHGFNCAESTNFATERWIEYGKHAVRCRCCPDAVNISMETFVRRFQPSIYDEWKLGRDTTPHPEYNSANAIDTTEKQTFNKQMSFVERNPDLNIGDILENAFVSKDIKEELRCSFLVSAEDEVLGMEADYDEREAAKRKRLFSESSSEDDFDDEDYKPKKGRGRRKKHDSDYDDDWFETKGHKLVTEQGQIKKLGRPSGRDTRRRGRAAAVTAKVTEPVTAGKKAAATATPAKSEAAKGKEDKTSMSVANAKVTVIEKNEKKVTVMSGVPKEVPFLQATTAKPQSAAQNATRGPTYSDAFAQFLQSSKSKPEAAKVVPVPAAPKAPKKEAPAQKTSVIQHTAKAVPNTLAQPQQQPQRQADLVVDQNQRVKTEKLPQNAQNPVYAIQENTIVTQDGEQQKLYYTILDSSSTNGAFAQTFNKQYYGQQQQHSF